MASEKSSALMRSALIGIVLIGGSVFLRSLYVFFFTDYHHYLISDMGGYWVRAFDRYNGRDVDYSQWAVWPPFYHILLSDCFHIFTSVGIPQTHWHASVLLLQILLGGISVYALYGISEIILKSRRLAFAAAALYGLAYPIIFFNALIISESVAIPLLIIATFLLLKYPRDISLLAISGMILGLTVGLRPAYAPFIAAFVIFAWAACAPGRKRFNSLYLLAGFVLVTGLICHENKRISNGELNGLSANGGVNFCIAQCKIYKMHSDAIFHGGHYIFEIVHPQFSGEPWRATMRTDQPMSNQAYFYKTGLDCMKYPQTWWEDFTQLRKLFFGPMFPTLYTAKGFEQIMPFCMWSLGILALAAIFLPPVLWIRDKKTFSKETALIWSFLPLTVVLCYFFGSERRFLYSEIFVVYPVLFSCAISIRQMVERRKLNKTITEAQ